MLSSWSVLAGLARPAHRSRARAFASYSVSSYAPAPATTTAAAAAAAAAPGNGTLSAAETEALYASIMARFPKPPQYAFAYGSGVFNQKGVSSSDRSANMIDFVFAVDNPTDWHAANLRANPTDYSFLRVLGARGVTAVQSKFGAGIYYNTLVPSNGRLIKYGVISSQALYRDLVDWNSLYVAGRLHKPSKHLLGPLNQTLATHERLARDSALSVPQSVDSCGLVPSSVEMLHAQHWNLLSATRAALLTLPETFSFRDLCLAVSGLSYTGDFRMTFGENPNKVGNIVDANLEHFVELYATPLLVDLRDGVTLLSTRRESGLPRWQPTTQFQQDTSPTARQRLLQNVPRGLSEALAHVKQNAPRSLTRAAPEASGGLSIPNRSQILAGVAQIVAGTAISQSLKGILTGGVLKASRYALQKVGKMRSASK